MILILRGRRVAGTDSIATTMRVTLLHVVTNPAVYQRLRAELDEASASGQIGDKDSIIKYAEAKQLPYLQAVIREGMRIFPGASSLFPKEVPYGGDVISGKHLPGGTNVGANVYGILRSKKYWGDDADLFRPERWLGTTDARLEQMNAAFEVMFGYGRYKCLGRTMAFMEMNKVIPEVRLFIPEKGLLDNAAELLTCFPQLIRRYDFTLVNAFSPVTMVNMGFTSMDDMWMRLESRGTTSSHD